MKKIKVAINGLGRIGRAFLRAVGERGEKGEKGERGIEIVAVNDLMPRENAEYLLRHDSVYGTTNYSACADASADRQLPTTNYFSEKDPAKLPWKELDIDVVVESTGFFASAAASRAHLDAGAKRVVITAPIKEDKAQSTEAQKSNKTQTAQNTKRAETILVGINEEKLKTCTISSNASCTTNAASPIIAILDETLGVEKAVLNTVHAYTATQALIDGPAGKRGMREGRAAAVNIIPSSTGAAIAMTKAYPKLEGKFDGISLRVPVVCGSIADITFIAKRNTSAEKVNDILRKAAKMPRWRGIFAASDEELVSSDIIGSAEGAIAELSMTRVVGGNLVKVLAWYDNESGYASTLVKHVLKAGQSL